MMMLIAMALLVSLGLWAFVHVAPHWGLVDQPSSRSLHTTPTVVSGGIAPMLVLAAGLYTTMDFPGTQAVALMTLVLTAIGLLDDRHGLPSGVRFLCYLATGLLLCWLLLPAGSASITLLVMAGVAVAWCINLVNFMDGADGLAATQALCVAMGMGLIATFGTVPNAQLAWLSAMLFACWAPLLWFNWPPARLFMGDAGAIPLGFVLALMGLMALLTDLSMGLAWLILMMPFLVDTGFTLCIRILAGEPPHIAHREHAYQRLIAQVGSPLPITLGLLGMQVIWQFPLAVTVVNSTVFPSLLVLLSAIPSVAAVVYARLRA
jgi:Fuc2NAc and GlcNAc transferase